MLALLIEGWDWDWDWDWDWGWGWGWSRRHLLRKPAQPPLHAGGLSCTPRCEGRRMRRGRHARGFNANRAWPPWAALCPD